MTLESMSRAAAPAAGAADAPARLHPSIALAPYVEALVVGRRVAVLGDVSLDVSDALLSRGARLVHAYDPDPARVAEVIARKAPAFGAPAAGRPAARGVVHALLGDDLGVRDGAFDAVVIPDLSLFADRADVVRRARKLVASAGAVVVASPNPEAHRRLIGGAASGAPAPGYYELFDLLSLQFPFVRMVGQAPFVGYSIVEFAPDREPDVTFDASLMSGTEEPETFVAIAGDRPVALDPYVVVEVPSAAVLRSGAAPLEIAAERAREERLGPDDHVKLAEMQARLVLMEAELEDLRAKKGELARELEGARAAAEKAEGLAREAAEETREREREAERKAALQAERWRDLEARAGDEHVRAERLTHKVRDLEEELVRQRDRAQKLAKVLDDEKRARQKAEIELGMARGLSRPELDEGTVARIEELSEALKNSKAHADSLASELLAKSKETAELRREHEAASAKIADLGRALAAAQKQIEDIEEEAQTIRRPMREAVPITDDVGAGMIAQLTRAEAAANAERLAAEELRRSVERAERQRDSAAERADKLEATLEQERRERRDLMVAKAALEAEVTALTRRHEQSLLERDAEAAPEVSHLEAALRDRGQRIAALERDLRESERIGRELVAEIEALGGPGSGGGEQHGGGGPAHGAGARGAGGPVPGARAAEAAAAASVFEALNADAFQHRIDALASDAAQKQAELLASGWKIQALERELTLARAAAADPTLAQRELSSALVRAQAEISDLRRALSQRGRDGSGVPRAVVESAVLLHQQMGR